ncbi:MAG: hypothetical protein ACR2H1_04720 [Limisphaerales bacterium]
MEKVIGGVVCLMLFMVSSLRGETNFWIKPGDGKWEEANAWSLGVVPNGLQSVAITNDGAKTITIDLATSEGSPQSTAIHWLTLGNSNTLLLNNIGTNVAFHVAVTNNSDFYSHAEIFSGSKLVNLNSAFLVDLFLNLYGGEIAQDGGIVAAGSCAVSGGQYYLTNGTFEANLSVVGLGKFNQFGGAAQMRFELYVAGGNYALHAGNLFVAEQAIVTGTPCASGEFVQNGGTNSIRDYGLSVRSYDQSNIGRYLLNGGILNVNNMGIGDYGTLVQTGGVAVVTNRIEIDGTFRNRPRGDLAFGRGVYSLVGGVLSAQEIQLWGYNATYTQAGGVADFGSILFSSLDGQSLLLLSGGRLSCRNVVANNSSWYLSGANILQSGGDFRIENLFSFQGGYPYVNDDGSLGYTPSARYTFTGGTLYASNIQMEAEMIIGGSTNIGRISNPGYFKMAGTLRVGDADEQLGHFILASNATINLGDGNAKLSFTNSSAEVWNSAATLVVTNWSGSTNGGGDDQLKFGSDASGLATSQLGQIRFINPAGFPSGNYSSQILNTGEIVPAPRPTLLSMLDGTNLVLSWAANFSLQTATNVSGPYEDVSTTSPYTNNFKISPQRYFRLRQ